MRPLHQAAGYLRQFNKQIDRISKRPAQWLDRQPGSQFVSHIQSLAALGGWLAAVNGAGLATSIALQIAAYTSLPGASDHICVAINFVSDAAGAGQRFSRWFVAGGLFALAVKATPNVISLFRNLDKLSSRAAFQFSVAQFMLVAWSGAIAGLIIYSLFSKLDVSQKSLSKSWSEFEEPCLRSSSPLHVSIPNLRLQDWRPP